jgi:multiple antibiotic resistance protein
VNFGIADIIMILFVTIGPIKAAIALGTFTAGADSAMRRAIALRAVMVATIVTLVFVFFGDLLLHVFHVSLPALKLAGGLILTIFSIGMIFSDHEKEGGELPPPSLALATYPIAVPMLATPQGLVAIVAITAGAETMGHVFLIAVIVLAIMAVNAVVLVLADKIIKLLGPAVLQVVAKVFGVLLAALAMQLMILGLQDLGLIAMDVGH